MSADMKTLCSWHSRRNFLLKPNTIALAMQSRLLMPKSRGFEKYWGKSMNWKSSSIRCAEYERSWEASELESKLWTGELGNGWRGVVHGSLLGIFTTFIHLRRRHLRQTIKDLLVVSSRTQGGSIGRTLASRHWWSFLPYEYPSVWRPWLFTSMLTETFGLYFLLAV